MGLGVMTWVKSSLHHLSPMPQIVTYCSVTSMLLRRRDGDGHHPGNARGLMRLRDTGVADRDHRNACREVVGVGVELGRIARSGPAP